jgi:hypothetical protein
MNDLTVTVNAAQMKQIHAALILVGCDISGFSRRASRGTTGTAV